METLQREIALALGLCTNCQARLPEDHGFDELCETCKKVEPISFIGGVASDTQKESVDLRIVNGVAVARAHKRKKIENGAIRRTSLNKRLAKKESDEKIELPNQEIVEKEFSNLNLESLTFEEVSELKERYDAELAKVKYDLIAVSKGSTIWKELESRRTVLGLRCQKLQVIRKQKKIPYTKKIQESVDAMQFERSNHFMHTFFHVASRLLSPDILEMVKIQARIESGQE